eukprot:GAFH01005050.1.p2 GENE.GAFH01005050.1~~GAFH01005050.1.p2  ORF type:complete len:146 (-),score=4.40 GAFH01005050.1:211-648(-)
MRACSNWLWRRRAPTPYAAHQVDRVLVVHEVLQPRRIRCPNRTSRPDGGAVIGLVLDQPAPASTRRCFFQASAAMCTSKENPRALAASPTAIPRLPVLATRMVCRRKRVRARSEVNAAATWQGSRSDWLTKPSLWAMRRAWTRTS